MYFNIFQYSSLQVYIYPNKPSKQLYLSIITQGYAWISYIFQCIFCIYIYIHCSIDRWNISLFYLYVYIHHYPNSPRSKHILLTYIIYPLISVTQLLFNDYPRIFMDYYHIYIQYNIQIYIIITMEVTVPYFWKSPYMLIYIDIYPLRLLQYMLLQFFVQYYSYYSINIRKDMSYH